MGVKKYITKRVRNYPEGRPPIFFLPYGKDRGWTPMLGGGFFGGLWRSKPFTDSWHLLHNPDKKDYFVGMPMASRYHCYVAGRVVDATPKEARDYLRLLVQETRPQYYFLSPK